MESSQKRFPHYNYEALTTAITLTMRNNKMRFGDTFTQQLVGIAMGTSPAPPIANLYVAIHETKQVLGYLNIFLQFYKIFINGGIGIWVHDKNETWDQNKWNKFKKCE